MFNSKSTLRVLAAMLIMAMALSVLSGCSAVITDPVVAKVGDVEIKYSAFYNAFSTYAQYGIINTTDATTVAEGRDMIMDMLVSSVIPTAEAIKEGVQLTDEEKQAALDNVADTMDGYLQQFLDDTIEDEAARREAAIKAFNEAYKANQITFDSVKKEMEAEGIQTAMGEKLVKDLYATIADASDEEIRARYDEELAADIEKYKEDPKAYNNDMQYSAYSGLRPLKAPEGLYYVKHILINNEDNAAEENKGRDHKALAEEVLAKVKAGEDFDALIAEYNEDPGMSSNPDGYIFSADFEGVYDEAFQKAGAALKAAGDTTDLVEGSYGYHIIKRAADISTDPISFDEVKEEIAGLIRSEKQNELYGQKIEEWREGLNITTYDKRVQYVGVR